MKQKINFLTLSPSATSVRNASAMLQISNDFSPCKPVLRCDSRFRIYPNLSILVMDLHVTDQTAFTNLSWVWFKIAATVLNVSDLGIETTP